MRLLLLSLILSFASFAAEPLMKGSVIVDIETGFLKADLCLEHVPAGPLVLNRGLNVAWFKAKFSKPLPYEVSAQGTDYQRYVVETPSGSDTLCLSYAGAFPVYAAQENQREYKGAIAFDKTSLRATEQSLWYPAVDGMDRWRYQLKISCRGCKSLYLNGSKPVRGSTATFSSDTPHPLVLLAGKFAFREKNGVLFVGDFPKAREALILSSLPKLSAIFQPWAGRKIEPAPVFMEFAATKPDRDWAFASFPTIAFTRHALSLPMTDEKSFIGFLAHEAAHFYFGNLVRPTGKQYWFLLESTAEFFSLVAIREMFGKEAFAERVDKKREDLVDAKDLVPILKVDDPDKIGERARYSLGPLVLLALEERVGTDKLKLAISTWVSDARGKSVDYLSFHEALVKAAIPPPEIARFEEECLSRIPDASCSRTYFRKGSS